ncbi:MAG: ATP:cob(I)alamin adenosyltransferase [Firmicutes bacterium]|nr:ATP:cob(I)alamin adenosyltransferase [Alicyclobacillaceae bacterium]MCL6496543.1 ATP:cob(I)alamin adenosyltransferase [Bacillota bacterium]
MKRVCGEQAGGSALPNRPPIGEWAQEEAWREEALGSLEEANAAVGVARAFLTNSWVNEVLEQVQNRLFALSAFFSQEHGGQPLGVGPDAVDQLQRWLEAADRDLFPVRNFVIPTGVPAAALLHWARTVVRRAARRVQALERDDPELAVAVDYLNRLADLIFALARKMNYEQGIGDIIASW